MKPAKSFFLFLCAALFFAKAEAQTPAGTAPVDAQGGPFDVSISTGLSIPIVAFASKNTSIEGSGLAKLGSDQTLQVSYRVWKYMSVALLGGLQINRYNVAAFNASSEAVESGVSMQGNGGYSARRLLAGITVDFPTAPGSRWSFAERVLAGVQYLESNNLLLSGADNSAGYTDLQETYKPGFATEVGMKMKYRFNRHWYAASGADFLDGISKISHTNVPINTGSAYYGGNVALTTINLHLGIGARF